MQGTNQTVVTEFLLLGFGELGGFRIPLFLLFLLTYIMILLANFLVILLVASNQSLHSPMYIFLSQMSASEIMFTSSVVPNLLHFVLVGRDTMLVSRCFTQFYLMGVPTIAQCLLLASMSFDRYVAICNPLHYMTTMTIRVQLLIVFMSWLLGFSVSLVVYVVLSRLTFCDGYIIDHFYCDIPPVLELSCSSTVAAELVSSLVTIPVVLLPCLFIIITYISILHTILKITTTSAKQKAFSTCSSHLAVVSAYYGTLTIIYIVPQKKNLVLNKGLSLLYTLVTPLFNPVVYSLKNQDIRKAAERNYRRDASQTKQRRHLTKIESDLSRRARERLERYGPNPSHDIIAEVMAEVSKLQREERELARMKEMEHTFQIWMMELGQIAKEPVSSRRYDDSRIQWMEREAVHEQMQESESHGNLHWFDQDSFTQEGEWPGFPSYNLRLSEDIELWRNRFLGSCPFKEGTKVEGASATKGLNYEPTSSL